MHVVQNTTHDGAQINWIASHKADRDLKESWSAPGKVEDALDLVTGWDPTIRRVMELTPSCLDWLIVYRDPLPTWISKTGNVALMGDAAQYGFLHVKGNALLILCLFFWPVPIYPQVLKVLV